MRQKNVPEQILRIKERKFLNKIGKFIIKGGRPLEGAVDISGAKNAVVAILPSVVLSDEVCTISNVPDISDVRICIKILRHLGAIVTQPARETYVIDPRPINSQCVPYEYTQKMRASYYFLGALLGKFIPLI